MNNLEMHNPKYKYRRNSQVSKALRILDIFVSNPKAVLDARTCCKYYNLYYNDKISLNAASLIITRNFAKGNFIRTPTQLSTGYYYSYNNKKQLDEIYNNYLVPYEIEKRDFIRSELLKNNFIRLPTDEEIDYESIKKFTFVEKYGLDYFRKREVQEFLASNIAFLLFDGHLRKDLEQIQLFFRYKQDAQLFINKFTNIFFKEYLSLNKTKFCYHVSFCNKSYCRLLYSFKMPSGNKIYQPFCVPDWIYYGKNSIKKSFVSTAIGNEGSAPSDNRWRIQFVLSKCEEYIPNLIFILNQIRNMLFHFKITTSHIQLRKQTRGNRQFNGRFYIRGRKNLTLFNNHFHFAYASEKQNT